MAEIVKFDHYEVLTHEDGSLLELGRGAMGITYKAFDTNLRVPVALKVINLRYLNSEIARQRFVREARAAAQLRHANVASVFHLGATGEAYFYAMEFVDGETVEALIIRNGPLDPALALRITIQVTRALAAATKHGLVHRDIKPANLMLVKEDDDYAVKVIDFGLAKSTKRGENEDLATLSMGGFVGTAHFASPEQLEEKAIDVRSDIYSLGVTLWYMLAGRAPFGGSIAQVMSQHLHKSPPLEQLDHVAGDLRALVAKMIEKDPAKRPQTPGDLRVELENCLAHLPPAVPSGAENFPTVAGSGRLTSTAVPSAAQDVGETVVAGLDRVVTPSHPLKLWPVLGSVIAAIAIVAIGDLIYLKTRWAPNVTSSNRPIASPAESAIPERIPAPVPSIASTTATVAPASSPERQTLLKQAVLDAETFEAAENWPKAIAAYVRVQKEFPENDVGKVRLQLLLDKVQHAAAAMNDEDFERMRAPLTDAAKLDVVAAMEILGDKLRERDPVASFNWWCSAAARGRAGAMREVGLRYASGAGVEHDLVQAARWFDFARQEGDMTAKTLLAECYLLGKGVGKNEAKAIEFLRDAAAGNDARAMDRLADCYHKGIGVPQDDREAFRLYSQAAKLNYLDSLGNLGVLYMVSTETDLGKDKHAREQKAVTLFRQGAEQNNPWCILQYARCLESGTGVESDPAAAASWYRRAALAGSRPAQDWCREHRVALTSDDGR